MLAAPYSRDLYSQVVISRRFRLTYALALKVWTRFGTVIPGLLCYRYFLGSTISGAALVINQKPSLTGAEGIIRIRVPFSGGPTAGLWFFIAWSHVWCRVNAFEFV